MKNYAIIGAGGHCRSVLALLNSVNLIPSAIYDDGFVSAEDILGVSLVGKPDTIPSDSKIILAIGNNEARAKYFNLKNEQIYRDLIAHQKSLIEPHTEIGIANLVFAFSYLNNGVQIGDNNLINTRATLEHEVKIGSHNHISVGAALLGRAQIGNHCFIGSGAIIRDGITICDHVTIGANSYVAQSIHEPGIYVGSPAEKIK